MAYAPATLNLFVATGIAGGPQIWTHRSTDAAAAVDLAGFITDGGDRGMLVGDIVFHQDTDNSNLTSSHIVISVSATAPGAVDLADGVLITSATNTD